MFQIILWNFSQILENTMMNCSDERSFQCLKRIKNYLQSSIGQTRLGSLSFLSIEHVVMDVHSIDDIFSDFEALENSKKVDKGHVFAKTCCSILICNCRALMPLMLCYNIVLFS